MTAEQAVEYIFENLDAFRTKYADVIAKFERQGIDHAKAEALTITILASAKAVSDLVK